MEVFDVFERQSKGTCRVHQGARWLHVARTHTYGGMSSSREMRACFIMHMSVVGVCSFILHQPSWPLLSRLVCSDVGKSSLAAVNFGIMYRRQVIGLIVQISYTQLHDFLVTLSRNAHPITESVHCYSCMQRNEELWVHNVVSMSKYSFPLKQLLK